MTQAACTSVGLCIHSSLSLQRTTLLIIKNSKHKRQVEPSYGQQSEERDYFSVLHAAIGAYLLDVCSNRAQSSVEDVGLKRSHGIQLHQRGSQALTDTYSSRCNGYVSVGGVWGADWCRELAARCSNPQSTVQHTAT